LNALQDAVPSAANLSYYLDIVEEKSLLRKMISTCTDVVGRVYDFDGEVDELLDGVERDILRLAESRVGGTITPTKVLVNQAIGLVENYFNRKGEIGGLATGFADLDRMTDGLHGGEMIVIAARPSMGKTALAMNIAEFVVLNQKLPVGVFSLEMSAESLTLRMLCSQARVNLRSIRDGFMSETDFPKLTSAAGERDPGHVVVHSAEPNHDVAVGAEGAFRGHAPNVRVLRRHPQTHGRAQGHAVERDPTGLGGMGGPQVGQRRLQVADFELGQRGFSGPAVPVVSEIEIEKVVAPLGV
jgi:hypothetical protein